MSVRRLWVVLGVSVSMAGIGLTGCDPLAFIPSDGTGFGVWITNESEGRVLVAFEPAPGEAPTWDVPSGTVDGRGPWMSLAVEGAAGDTGEILLYDDDCVVMETLAVDAGEYRMHVGADGRVTLAPDDVLNDAGEPLRPATVTC